MKICKLKSNAPCSTNEIVKSLVEDVCSEEKPFLRQFVEEEHTISILIVEDYFFRINSTLSVTVIIDEFAEYTIVEIISNGGKVGLWSETYGAENSAVKKMVKALKRIGFVEIED